MVTRPDRYGDGRGSAGLALLVTRTSAGHITKRWIQRVRIHGQANNIALGRLPAVSLREARGLALGNADTAAAGRDPRQPSTLTFEQAAEVVISLSLDAWKDAPLMASKWRAGLRDYACPVIGRMAVSDVTSGHILAILAPIWVSKPATAKRVRGHMRAILDWAMAQGYRSGDNPAGAAITKALPSNGNATKHQRAVPHGECTAALARVRESRSAASTKLAFEFLVLTACRSGEVRGARWSEIDAGSATWTIPAARMKAKRDHRVPLSNAALAVLCAARDLSDGSGLVFPSAAGGAISDFGLSRVLQRLNIGAVPHGFRSSFRDWCSDTGAPRELAEAALAHVVRGVEGAYARSDLLERRRELMQAWADYLQTTRI